MNATSARPRWATRAVGTLGAVAVGSTLLLVGTGTAQAAETATDGSLSWGVKQSFRNYIAGPIAHGSVTTSAGASTNTDGTYAFPAASGTVDGSTVDAAFDGSVFFSGHAGVLEITISDVTVALSGSTGTLYADVDSRPFASTTSPSPVQHYEDIDLASLDLSGVTPTVSGSTTSWSAIPATMTANGAPAFAGFYAAGTALDPVSFSLTTTPATDPDPGTDPEPEPEAPAEDEQDLTVVVPETTPEPEPGAFGWEISGDDSAVSLGTAAPAGDHLAATGQLKPVVVTDTRATQSAWSITAQVSDFTAGSSTLDGSHLGWAPKVLVAGADATAGSVVPSGLLSGDGLSAVATLGSAPTGHTLGSATLGADLDLKLPTSTPAGTYAATLTLTALS